MKTISQHLPFACVISDEYKAALQKQAEDFEVDYGIFFDTSGMARCERINPTARYKYVWTTRETIKE